MHAQSMMMHPRPLKPIPTVHSLNYQSLGVMGCEESGDCCIEVGGTTQWSPRAPSPPEGIAVEDVAVEHAKALRELLPFREIAFRDCIEPEH
mmetsp:Transcript_32781/g.81625  ORF Transcript_32781/g.81625 Transcript_32781/m.81625 type:complete len:92 (-) Transcript_32781:859-1134(-)